MLADAREVMNIRQASHYLGVSPDTLYKYVSEEMIPAFKLGNRWKFKKSVLDNWMENQSFHKRSVPAAQTGQAGPGHGGRRLRRFQNGCGTGSVGGYTNPGTAINSG